MDRRFFMTAAAACAGAAGHAAAQGRPWDQVVGPTVADRGSPHYTFTSFLLASADQKRRYWVQVGIPKRPAPAKGYPAIYMLDGNAAMAAITEADLAELDALSPPVLVAVGHDTHARNDVIARAYDYTPPVSRDGGEIAPIVRGRPGGGAEIFAELIETAIKPKVESLAPIDRERQTLWGHSYGGLFALYVLAAHPEFYRNYAAGDPSFWWHDGVLVTQLDALSPSRIRGKTIRIMSGGGRTARTSTAATARPAPQPAPRPQPVVERPADTSLGAPPRPAVASDFAKRFSAAGVDVAYQEFDGFSHGQMLPASLGPALRLAAR